MNLATALLAARGTLLLLYVQYNRFRPFAGSGQSVLQANTDKKDVASNIKSVLWLTLKQNQWLVMPQNTPLDKPKEDCKKKS